MMQVRVLGPVGLWVDDVEVVVPAGKPVGVLAMLALSAGRPVSVERLVIGLWGEDAPTSSSKTLQVHISTLRKRIGPFGLDVPHGSAGYELVAPGAEIDVVDFDRLAEEGRHALVEGRPEIGRRSLRAALALWNGPPLSNVLGAPFAAEEADRLAMRQVAAHALAVEADLQLGLGVMLVDEVRALAESNPYDERICGQLMVVLYRAGQPAAALAEFGAFRRRLRDELGLDPGPELVAVEHQVLVHDADLLRREGVAVSRSNNLGEDVSTFIGRRRECDELRDRLERVRMVTVAGAGGTGKTRLVTAVARSMLDAMPDGVWFVDLSPIADPRFVPSAVAEVVDVRADDLDALIEGLESRRLLLVVDNCEHLVDHVAELVGSVLRRCPHVKVLATSREPLAIDGEAIYRIPPMDVPAADAVSADVADCDAIALFADRARLQSPEFAIDARTAPLVVAICIRVDGLPLAIELAAARLGSLSLEEIAHRLEQRLALLAGVNRRTLGRHQTLRALIDWSYELLDAEEQRLLEALAVFAGGFDVAAVEAVVANGARTVDLLGALVNKSMVEFADRAHDRFYLLEAIREYAADRLAARGGEAVEGLRRAHACHYTELASVGGDALERGHDERQWIDRLSIDHDNLRAAGNTLLETGDHDRALHLASYLRLFWDTRGDFREGAEVTKSVLAAASPIETPHAYGRALLTAADMSESLGDLDAALDLAHRAEQLAADFDEPTIGLGATLVMASVDVQRGHPDTARRRIAALDLSTADTMTVHRAHSIDAAAATACEDWASARSIYEHLVAATETMRSDRLLASTLSNLACVEIGVGDLDAARSSLERAYTLAAALRDATTLGYISGNLGLLAHLGGDAVAAYIRYREELLNPTQESFVVHNALLGLMLGARLDPPDGDDAVRLHGVIERFVDANPFALLPTEERLREADWQRRRDHVGGADFDRLRLEARLLTLAEAIDCAHTIRPPEPDHPMG